MMEYELLTPQCSAFYLSARVTAANLLSAFETRPSTIDPWNPELNYPQTTNYGCSTVHVLGARGDRDTLRTTMFYRVVQLL